MTSLNAAPKIGHGKIYDSICDVIGNTPLVRIPKLTHQLGLKADILLKLEFFNPLASVKDRIGKAMIEDLEVKGKINKDTIIVEPTSGNTGIALAFVAAAKGYKIILCMPESMSIERRKILRYLGAKLELTPAAKGMKGAIERAEQIVSEMKNAVMPQQFANPANPKIHEETTALEILADINQDDFGAFIAGVGTGGTITGCGTVFKKKGLNAKIIAVEPTDSPVLSGGAPGPHKIQGIGAGFIPDTLDMNVVDEILQVSNEKAFEMAQLLAATEGVPAGISSGGNLAAAIEIAKRPEMANKKIVVIIPSFAERYISTALFDGLEG